MEKKSMPDSADCRSAPSSLQLIKNSRASKVSVSASSSCLKETASISKKLAQLVKRCWVNNSLGWYIKERWNCRNRKETHWILVINHWTNEQVTWDLFTNRTCLCIFFLGTYGKIRKKWNFRNKMDRHTKS